MHRVPGGERRVVFAYRREIDAWSGRPDNEVHGNGRSSATPNSGVGQSGRHLGEKETLGATLSLHNSGAFEDALLPLAGSQRRPQRLLVLTLVACTALILLVLGFFFNSKKARVVDPLSSDAPIVPQGIEHWLRVSLVNGQSDDVKGPFQQVVIVDSSKYAPFEADNLQNIEFFDEQGNVLQSWLESGNSKLAISTVYWVQLPNGIPGRKVVDIYETFDPLDETCLAHRKPAKHLC